MVENKDVQQLGLTEVAGAKVEIWTGGQGRPLLFLHPAEGLDSSIPVLDALAQQYRVTAPSHPGFGGSELPNGFTSVDDLAYFYLDFLDHCGLSDTLLVGVSFGAWIAAEIATKCTDRLSGIVLADALGAKFGDRDTREITDLLSIPQYDHGQVFYSDRRKIDYSAASDELLQRLSRNHASLAHLAWSPTLYNPKLRQRLHRIQIPTLVLWGSEDRVVSSDYGRQFAASIPGARFELIPGAGHYAHLERTDRFIQSIAGFSDGLPSRNPSTLSH